MKTLYFAATTASTVTLLCVIGVQLALKDSEQQLLSAAIGDLEAMVSANADKISDLSVQQRYLRDSLSTKGAFIVENVAQSPSISADEDYIERLESVEDALEKLSAPRSLTPEMRKTALESHIRERSISSDVLDAHTYTKAETYFESHSGQPIGNYSDSIENAIHSVGGIEPQSVVCRTSICKITYRSSSFATENDDDLDSSFADELMFGVDGRTVELRYAKDELGNQVIYAEVK